MLTGPERGMAAVGRIEAPDCAAFIVTDGNDSFEGLT